MFTKRPGRRQCGEKSERVVEYGALPTADLPQASIL